VNETLSDRVAAAIDASGLTRRDFAAAIGLDASKLSKSLRGVRRFSSLELALVAEVGRRSVDWLLTGRNAPQPHFARRSTLAENSADTTGADVVLQLSERFAALAELERPVEVPALPAIGESAGGYVQQARQLAAKYVEALGAEAMSTLDTLDLIDAMERKFGVIVVIKDLPDTIDGLSYQDGDFRAIVLAASDKPLRQRFTLAHELAHIAFGDARQGVIEETLWTDSNSSESRANTFAAAFLAPAAEIDRVLDGRLAAEAFDDLVTRFRLSPGSMAWCLYNQRLLSSSEKNARLNLTGRSVFFRSQKSQEYTRLATDSQTARPAWTLVGEYLRAYDDGEITIKPVANLLGWSPARAESFFDSGPRPGEVEGQPEGA
jgi:Zn-dependent peptidase ImmA (M78 family)/transcriptional regulator with XRE-family HTH domain